MRPMYRLSGSLLAKKKKSCAVCQNQLNLAGLLFSHLLMLADVGQSHVWVYIPDRLVWLSPFCCWFVMVLLRFLHPVGLKLSAVHLPFHSCSFMTLKMLTSWAKLIRVLRKVQSEAICEVPLMNVLIWNNVFVLRACGCSQKQNERLKLTFWGRKKMHNS